ncbi:MAG: four helix bundle protein [Bacteroidales bacterium]
MKHQYSFERLDVFQESRALAKDIYILTARFPSDEKYGLTSQVKRASISVVSNIAEGSGRNSPKEQMRFLEIAMDQH